MAKQALLIILIVVLEACSSKISSSSQSASASLKTQRVPFSLTYAQPLGLNLEGGGSGSLNLVSIATNINVSVSGCKTGYTLASSPITSGFVNLYKGDPSCLVKLQSFTFGSTTYASTGQNAVSFTTWLAGDVATFENMSSTTDLIKVFVKSQVSGSGVLSTDTVAYNFTDIQAGTADTVSQVSVSSGVPLSVLGNASPNFSIVQARYLSTNTNGSANMSFTLGCGDALTGSSNSTYACDSVLLQSQLSYILIPDAYSQGAITVAQANTAFAANTPTSIGTLIVAPGGTDLNSNVVANGGFYSSNASPLVTGTAAIYPNNLNNVFMLRENDTSGNTKSYIYFYVNIASIVQYSDTAVSGCGTTFAGGAGTSGSPYLIIDATTLANTAHCSTSSTFFIQGNNIDLGGSSTPWTPITLSGQYNGGGFAITGLYENNTTSVDGLFNTIQSGASVSNLTLSSINITSSQNAGAFAGQSSGSLTNCSASGTITVAGTVSSADVGGLVGNQTGGSITSSSSSVNIQSQATANTVIIGGLAGLLSGSSISSSFATGSMSATSGSNSNELVLAGLVGNLGASSISNTYSTGNLTSTISTSSAWIGMIGLAGSSSAISGCFGTGTYSISGSTSQIVLGGVVGQDLSSSGTPLTLSNSYVMVTSSITASGFGIIGGIVGYSQSNGMHISSSYSASPSMTGSGGGITGIGTPTISNTYLYQDGSDFSDSESGVTTYTTSTQMQTQGNFGGFTFGTSPQNWKMPSANPLSPTGLLSPVLFWQCGSNGIVCP